MAVAITRGDLSASDLRRVAGRCVDSALARRALALALVLEGKSRLEAARRAGMDRQTLRDWVHRYNELFQRARAIPGRMRLRRRHTKKLHRAGRRRRSRPRPRQTDRALVAR